MTALLIAGLLLLLVMASLAPSLEGRMRRSQEPYSRHCEDCGHTMAWEDRVCWWCCTDQPPPPSLGIVEQA